MFILWFRRFSVVQNSIQTDPKSGRCIVPARRASRLRQVREESKGRPSCATAGRSMFRASLWRGPNINKKRKKEKRRKKKPSSHIVTTTEKRDKNQKQDPLFTTQFPNLIKQVEEEEQDLVEDQELEYDDVQEEGEESPAFDIKSTAPSHKYDIQPLGNLLLSPTPFNSRNPGLGNLRCLPDELLIDLLSLLGPTHLAQLSTVSKALYVFANHDPLWRTIVLDHLPRGFCFTGSWKSTYVFAFHPSFAAHSTIQVKDFYSDYLFQSWLCANLEMKAQWLEIDNIERRRGISVEEFVREFEELNKPVLLEGCLDKWAAIEKWDRDYLILVAGDTAFSAGPVEMKLGEYFGYSDLVKEERPLYLFDPKFGEKVPELGADYEVPVYFREDLFAVLEEERPDYRWIIIGPAGSGSSFHVDPNSTSAWNAVIRGSKKWVLFPPDVVPPGVHPSPDGAEVAYPVAIMEWFMNFYGATKKWKKRPVECVCKAGEVVFVPNGWWHLVINLEESIAITQNYVSRRNLLNVLEFLKRPNASELVSGTRDRVNLYDKFKTAIEASYPGIIDEVTQKANEKKAQQKKPTFWESVTDAKVGGFKFSF